MIYLVIELLSSIRISFYYEYICLNCCCMVSFLKVDSDCKSNNLNCGNFALGIYSHPHPSGYFTGTGAIDSGEARE